MAEETAKEVFARKIEEADRSGRKLGLADFTAQEGEPAWGIYNTQEKCWLGDSKGPFRYNDELVSIIAAQAFGVRLELEPGVVVSQPYDGTGTQLRDKVTPRISGVEAIKIMESGSDEAKD